jgi:hypothetical protein
LDGLDADWFDNLGPAKTTPEDLNNEAQRASTQLWELQQLFQQASNHSLGNTLAGEDGSYGSTWEEEMGLASGP